MLFAIHWRLLLRVEIGLLGKLFELHDVAIDLQLALLPRRLEQLLRKPGKCSVRFNT